MGKKGLIFSTKMVIQNADKAVMHSVHLLYDFERFHKSVFFNKRHAKDGMSRVIRRMGRS